MSSYATWEFHHENKTERREDVLSSPIFIHYIKQVLKEGNEQCKPSCI